MSSPNPLGFGIPRLESRPETVHEFILVQRPLRRVLAFTGHSIDQVCNCPIVKRKVLGYFKLHKEVDRWSEITELERQWNGR